MRLSSRQEQGPSLDTKDQPQLTSDLGIFTEAPLRKKDGYVAVATVPEVLHSDGDAPAGEAVLEAMPAGGRGHTLRPPRRAWWPGWRVSLWAHIAMGNTTSHLTPLSSAPPGTHSMATLLPSMTI